MTDLIYDYITQGVDLLISAAIISSISILLGANTQLQSAMAMQQAGREEMRYYTQFNQYDGTNVKGITVASAAIHYKNDTRIIIVRDSTIEYFDLYESNAIGLNGKPCSTGMTRTQDALIYDPSNPSNKGIDPATVFRAYLDRTSGGVDAIIFVQDGTTLLSSTNYDDVVDTVRSWYM